MFLLKLLLFSIICVAVFMQTSAESIDDGLWDFGWDDYDEYDDDKTKSAENIDGNPNSDEVLQNSIVNETITEKLDLDNIFAGNFMREHDANNMNQTVEDKQNPSDKEMKYENNINSEEQDDKKFQKPDIAPVFLDINNLKRNDNILRDNNDDFSDLFDDQPRSSEPLFDDEEKVDLAQDFEDNLKTLNKTQVPDELTVLETSNPGDDESLAAEVKEIFDTVDENLSKYENINMEDQYVIEDSKNLEGDTDVNINEEPDFDDAYETEDFDLDNQIDKPLAPSENEPIIDFKSDEKLENDDDDTFDFGFDILSNLLSSGNDQKQESKNAVEKDLDQLEEMNADDKKLDFNESNNDEPIDVDDYIDESDEFDDILSEVDKSTQVKSEFYRNFDDGNVPVTHMTISVDDYVTVTSDNYPGLYPPSSVADYEFDGVNGTGIEFIINDLDLNGDSGDYILIKPGGLSNSESDGIFFTYTYYESKKYRFFDVNSLFLRFEARAETNDRYKGFNISVKFIDKELETKAAEVLEEDIAEVPAESITIYLGGATPVQFLDLVDEFKAVLVDMAALYCEAKSIDVGVLPISDVIQVTSISSCIINWPSADNCVAVTFSIPLSYNTTADEHHAYQLNTNQLETMWLMYADTDEFEGRISKLGLNSFMVPNDVAIMTLWLVISAGVLLSVIMLAIAIWRWNCFGDYTGMRRLSEVESVVSSKGSKGSLFPTPHQNLPPLYGDTNMWIEDDDDIPPKYSDAQQDNGYSNKSFVRDGELFDLDSDEEIVMSLPDDGKVGHRYLTTDA